LILDTSLTAREMKAVEMNADYLGVTKLMLMENAGTSVARAVMDVSNPRKKVVIACGTGGNGGDGFVAARHLAHEGYDMEVYLMGKPENIRSDETSVNWCVLKNMTESIKIKEIHDSTEIGSLKAEVIVDALVGTGVRGAISSPMREMVKAINESNATVIAVDVPTGIETDTGETHGEAVKGDITLTFHKLKIGLNRAKEYTGKIKVCPIGIPPESETYAGPGDVYLAQKRRTASSHKGDFGRLLVVGGSETYSGAPALTAMGAYAAGVDIVYVAAPEEAASVIAGFSSSLITLKLRGQRLSRKNLSAALEFIDKVDAVAIGPGLGMHEETVATISMFLDKVNEAGIPVLLDADGLKAFPSWGGKIETAVFTPHRSEFKILTGKNIECALSEQRDIVRKEASKLGATILLKGSVDVISDGSRTRCNRTGNPGMTVGGTGDVLAGVVSGYLASGVNPMQAAVTGAFVNGAAGDAAYEEKGYNFEASDLLEKIPLVIKDALGWKMRCINN
jgi:NAD(P)H-hydrate epimerase